MLKKIYLTLIFLPLVACMETPLGSFPTTTVTNPTSQGLDEAAQKKANDSQNYALERSPSGQVNTWKTPDNRVRGEITVKPVINRGSTPCRDYTHTIYTMDKPQTTNGTACRTGDGVWQKA